MSACICVVCFCENGEEKCVCLPLMHFPVIYPPPSPYCTSFVQGIKNLSPAEADRLASADPDYAIRDLYNSIGGGDYPSWTVYVQVMSVDEAESMAFNPFDVTKVQDAI